MQLDMPPDSAPSPDQQAALQRLRRFRQALVIGLMTFSLLILLFSLYLISASVQNDITRSEANLTVAQAQVLRLQTPAPEVQTYLKTLTDTVALADNLVAARPPLGRNWPAIVAQISSYNPTAITLTSLTQVDRRITLTGQAVNDVSVVDYVHTLEQSPLFTDVVLESIILLTPTPVPTQAATGPVAATAAFVNFVITIELSVAAP